MELKMADNIIEWKMKEDGCNRHEAISELTCDVASYISTVVDDGFILSTDDSAGMRFQCGSANNWWFRAMEKSDDMAPVSVVLLLSHRYKDPRDTFIMLLGMQIMDRFEWLKKSNETLFNVAVKHVSYMDGMIFGEGTKELAYLDNDGGCCPYCFAKDGEPGSPEGRGIIDVDGTQAFQDVICNECGGTWQDIYKLSGVHLTGKGDDEG